MQHRRTKCTYYKAIKQGIFITTPKKKKKKKPTEFSPPQEKQGRALVMLVVFFLIRYLIKFCGHSLDTVSLQSKTRSVSVSCKRCLGWKRLPHSRCCISFDSFTRLMRPSKTVPTRRLVLPDSAEYSTAGRRFSPDGLRSPAEEGFLCATILSSAHLY